MFSLKEAERCRLCRWSHTGWDLSPYLSQASAAVHSNQNRRQSRPVYVWLEALVREPAPRSRSDLQPQQQSSGGWRLRLFSLLSVLEAQNNICHTHLKCATYPRA